MKSLTIKLEPAQDEWLTEQSLSRQQSKGEIVRGLISKQLVPSAGSLAQTLSDLRGSLRGSRDLSTRPLKGYGRS